MSTPSLFPYLMKAGSSFATLQLLSEGLIVEVEEMPDVVVEQELTVEVASSEIVVSSKLPVDISADASPISPCTCASATKILSLRASSKVSSVSVPAVT